MVTAVYDEPFNTTLSVHIRLVSSGTSMSTPPPSKRLAVSSDLASGRVSSTPAERAVCNLSLSRSKYSGLREGPAPRPQARYGKKRLTRDLRMVLVGSGVKP